MNFTQLIQHKTLSQIRKQENGVESSGTNVCAIIPNELFIKLDAMCISLGMSKREFVEAALADALTKAGDIILEIEHQR